MGGIRIEELEGMWVGMCGEMMGKDKVRGGEKRRVLGILEEVMGK